MNVLCKSDADDGGGAGPERDSQEKIELMEEVVRELIEKERDAAKKSQLQQDWAAWREENSNLTGSRAKHRLLSACRDEEAINTPSCPLQDKFHTFALRGLRNMSEAP